MTKKKPKPTRDRSGDEAGSASVENLSADLEDLLKKSQHQASRLASLVEQSERAGEHLQQHLRRRSDRPATEPAESDEVEALTRRAEQLEAARAVAEAADRAKSCFLAAISRELRTPVDGLARMIELLRHTDLDAEQRRYLDTAGHSVGALLGLLDGALSASKVDAGLTELRTTDFDLRQVAGEVVEMLTPPARGAGVSLSLDVDAEVPNLVRGEAGRLRQVLLYAIRRSLQIGAAGPMSVGIDLKSSTESTATVRLTVSQSSVGVRSELLDSVFAPQSRLDGRELRSHQGVGLAIARRLVELLGGHIEVDAYDGGGFAIATTVPLDHYRTGNNERRMYGRLPQELLQSNLGPVLDLSMGGMRIRCRRPPAGRIEVHLQDIEGPVKVTAQVMWRRRVGMFRYEVGLSFPHVPPETAKQLSRVSLNHRLRRLLGVS